MIKALEIVILLFGLGLGAVILIKGRRGGEYE